MKKLLLTITLAGTLSSAFSSFGSAPTATKEQAEANPFLAHVLYKGTEAAIYGFVGYAMIKYAAKEFNASSNHQTKKKLEVFQPTETQTLLADLIGEKPQEFNHLIDMIDRPEKYKRLNAPFPKAFLMHGPPGTGKTELARGLANKLGATYFEVCGSQFESKWVGETSQRITALFAQARKAKPADNSQDIRAVIFIDEIETIAPKRNGYGTTHHSQQAVGTLLTEMTKKDENKHILIIGATNHKHMIDEAILRAGRFDAHIPVALPNEKTRASILKHYAKDFPMKRTQEIDEDELAKMPKEELKPGYLNKYPHLLKPAINFDAIAQKADKFSGADLQELCTKASRIAATQESEDIQQSHFDSALALMLKAKEKTSGF